MENGQGSKPMRSSLVSRDLIFRFLRSLEQEHGRSPGTIRTYRQVYTYFVRYLREQGIRAEKARIDREHVRGWVASMRSKGLGWATIRLRLAALSAFFGWLAEERLIERNPVAGIPRPGAESWEPRGALNEAEMDRIWHVALASRRLTDRQVRVALLLMWHCGARRGEVLGADWEDVDFARRSWYVKKGKGRRKRWVPLSELAVEHLRDLWQRRGRPTKGPILLSRTRRRLSQTSLYDVIKRWVRKAGLPHVSPHWFRHTFVTSLAERASSPADLRKIQKLAGHASVETTMVYLHVSDEDRTLIDQAFGGARTRPGPGAGGVGQPEPTLRGRPKLGLDLDQIHRLREEGLSLREIARECGVSPRTIRRVLQYPGAKVGQKPQDARSRQEGPTG